MIFDIENAFRKSGLKKEDREQLKQYCREEFGDDEMMYELHVIRAINAFKKGYFAHAPPQRRTVLAREAKETYSGDSEVGAEKEDETE